MIFEFVTEANAFTFYSQKICSLFSDTSFITSVRKSLDFWKIRKYSILGQLQNAHRMKQLTEKTLTLYMEMQKLEVHFYLLLKT